MEATTTTSSSTKPEAAGRREWIGLAVIALPCLLYSMDLTVLNLALPRISAELSPSSAQLLWIVDIYGFLVAGLLITMGNLGDRIGRRRLLLMGAAFFGAASVLAAFSVSAGMLIAARVLLGIAGATLAPSTLSLIRNMFPDPAQRTFAIGVWATSYSVGGAIGPVLGGVMLQFFWWGSVFLVGVPVMALLLVAGPILLPEFKDPKAGRLDFVSAALSLAAVLPIIYGIKLVAQHGVGWWAGLCIGVGIAIGWVFARRQRDLPDPLIDVRLFRVAGFTPALATFTLSTLVMFGSYVFIGQYLQLVMQLSPMKAGLWMLPSSAGFVVGSMVAPALVRHMRSANVMGAGLILGSVGFAVLTQLEMLGLAGVVVGSGCLSLGLAPVFTLGTDLIVGAAPPERAGAAAALSETSSEFGGALGIAILGSIGTAIYRMAMSRSALDNLKIPREAQQSALETLGGAVAAAETLSGPLGEALAAAARASFAHALQVTVGICSAVTAATAVLVFVKLRRARVGGEAAQASDATVETARVPGG